GIVTVWKTQDAKPELNKRSITSFEEACAIYEALDDPFYLAEALVWLGSCAGDRGDRSENPLKRGLELRRKIEDLNGIAWITLNLTEVVILDLDYVACERYAREALALMREIGSLKGVLQSMFKLSQIIMLRGDLDEARFYAEEIRR